MKILLTLLLVAMPLANLSARKVHTENTVMEVKPDTLMAITQLYLQRLDSLGRERDSLNTIVPQLVPNGYYAHVLTTPTLFSSVLAQMMSGVDSSKVAGDSQLRRAYAGNVALARMYVQAPWLVTQTEATIKQQGAFREDITEKLKTDDRLSDKVKGGSLTPTVDGDIVVVTRRPNFWKVTGNASLHFTQSRVGILASASPVV